VPLPAKWQKFVNGPEAEAELEVLRRSVRRGCPFGEVPWVDRTAKRLGLEATLRPQGRPKGAWLSSQRGLLQTRCIICAQPGCEARRGRRLEKRFRTQWQSNLTRGLTVECAFMICPSCATPKDDRADFCGKCGVPLSRHATMDPVASIYAQGYAARKAVSEPRNFIVVFGLWLRLAPIILCMVAVLVVGVPTVVSESRRYNIIELFGGLLGLIVILILGLCLCTMLYKSTKNYLRERGENAKPSNDSQRLRSNEPENQYVSILAQHFLTSGLPNSAKSGSYDRSPLDLMRMI